MATPLSTFRRHVAPDVPGCPNPVIDEAVMQAAIEFCKRVPVLRADYGPEAMLAADNAYTHPTDHKVYRLLQAWVDEQEVAAAHADQFSGAGNWIAQTGTPSALVYSETGYRPYPLATGQMTARVALIPDLAATDLDDALYTHHQEAITHGALYRLHARPKREWSDIELAAWHKSMFERSIDDAEHAQYRNAVLRTAKPPL